MKLTKSLLFNSKHGDTIETEDGIYEIVEEGEEEMWLIVSPLTSDQETYPVKCILDKP